MRIEPVHSLRGDITVPGDKSISHRYAILGGMASGRTTIAGFSASQDCQSTLDCLRALGIGVQRNGSDVAITSPGWKEVRQPESDLDAGNSGTTIRLLSALLASRPITSRVIGDESLSSRPMKRIIDPLTRMGARVEARENTFPPLVIYGNELNAIDYELPVASAQVKSCVLLAGVTASGKTTVLARTQTRDHTERALPFFGAPVKQEGSALSVEGPIKLSASSVRVPGDFSSAVYFLVAALLLPESELKITEVGVNPTRTGLMALLKESGALIQEDRAEFNASEPYCNLIATYSKSCIEEFPERVDGHWIPNLIDEIPILAVIGTRLRKGLMVRDASELRAKESDRIKAIVTNLNNLGVAVQEYEDGFHILPNQSVRGGRIKSYGDHRIAMAFSIAGLFSEEGVEIDDPGCADISFPGFFDKLKQIRYGTV